MNTTFMEEWKVPTVMTKYRYNDNNYLVYNTNLLQEGFSAYQLQQMAYDIEADYIIIFNGGKVSFYNIQGDEVSADTDMKEIALYHQTKDAAIAVTRQIEVRFTNSYISRITNSDIMQSYTA